MLLTVQNLLGGEVAHNRPPKLVTKVESWQTNEGVPRSSAYVAALIEYTCCCHAENLALGGILPGKT